MSGCLTRWTDSSSTRAPRLPVSLQISGRRDADNDVLAAGARSYMRPWQDADRATSAQDGDDRPGNERRVAFRVSGRG